MSWAYSDCSVCRSASVSVPLAEAIAMLRIMLSAAGRLFIAPATATVDRLVIGSGTCIAAWREAARFAALSARWVSWAVATRSSSRNAERAPASTRAVFAVFVASFENGVGMGVLGVNMARPSARGFPKEDARVHLAHGPCCAKVACTSAITAT